LKQARSLSIKIWIAVISRWLHSSTPALAAFVNTPALVLDSCSHFVQAIGGAFCQAI
jgi:hypothetical protein